MDTIDLGLPSGTLWATANLGATHPYEYGDYFAWGDTSTKQNYIGRTCETYDLNIIKLKFDDYINSDNVLTSYYDAATKKLGSGWSTPSGSQAQELIDNCKWEWVSNYENTGIDGMLGISKINGNKIFLPASGYKNNTQELFVNSNGGYWTGSPNLEASNRAWSIAFEPGVINVFNHGLRYKGYSIRPVKKHSK